METRTTLSGETLDRLRDLVRINRDSERGFLEAASRIENAALVEQFREHAEERRRNAVELRTVVEINDADIDEVGGIAGAVHRWWLDLRSCITSSDEAVMLREAARGEAAIKKLYEEVLKETGGSAVNDLLQRQYRGIKSCHDQIRSLAEMS